MWSKFWAVYVELPVGGGGLQADVLLSSNDLSNWSICKAIEFPRISQFLRVKDFRTLVSTCPSEDKVRPSLLCCELLVFTYTVHSLTSIDIITQ